MRIGQRILSGVRMGGKLIGSAGRIGGRITSLIGRAADSVKSIPLIGSMIAGTAPYQAMRGVISGASHVSNIADKAGTIIEKGAELGQHFTAPKPQASSQPFHTRTNVGATGNISVGNAAIIR